MKVLRSIHLASVAIGLAACLVSDDPEDFAEEEEDAEALRLERGQLAGECYLQRPYGWNRNGVSCVEHPDLTSTIAIPNGGVYHAVAYRRFPVLGNGSVDVRCTGDISEENKICRKGIIEQLAPSEQASETEAQ